MVDTSQGPVTSPGGAPKLTGNVPFFRRPEPLDPAHHGKLGLKQTDSPFKFARESHLAPITVAEFAAAAVSYPLVFLGDPLVPLCVMGLRQGQNLYIDRDGKPADESYLPAFVRRYPFTLAEDPQTNNFIVCIDAGSELVGENTETPFFDGTNPTEFTNNAIEFLKAFEQQRRVTSQLVDILKENDLFETREAEFQPRNPDGTAGNKIKVAEYQAVSLEKLHKLPDETYLKLRDNGALAAIYIHNASLVNWDRVMNRALRQAQDDIDAGLQPAQAPLDQQS